MMNKNYYAGTSRKFIGLGVMFETDPPYTNIRRAWMFELRLGWFKFWYVKEKKNKAKTSPKPIKSWGGEPLNTSKNARS